MRLNHPPQFVNHLYYWALPALIVGTLIAMYFSGIDPLRNIVAPDRLGREFGALENLQHLILLAIAAITFHACRRARERKAQLFFALASLFALFVFLEEIDYGLHYLQPLTATAPKQELEIRNLHNQELPYIGEVAGRMKQISDMGLIIFFIILPLVRANSTNPWLRYFLPSRFFVMAVLCSLVLSKTAHALDKMGLAETGALRSNISEFRELFLYYIWLMYFVDLVFRRSWPRPQSGEN